MLTQDDLERERYEARLKLQRDAQMHAEAAKVALQQGRAEGLKEGLAKGRLIGVIQFCQGELGHSVTPSEELGALSEEDLRRRADALRDELLGDKE
jgi:hypothetical protein